MSTIKERLQNAVRQRDEQISLQNQLKEEKLQAMKNMVSENKNQIFNEYAEHIMGELERGKGFIIAKKLYVLREDYTDYRGFGDSSYTIVGIFESKDKAIFYLETIKEKNVEKLGDDYVRDNTDLPSYTWDKEDRFHEELYIEERELIADN